VIRLAAAALLLLGAQAAPPNVVLIITDDQGYGDLGVHGNDRIQTPHLDKLAKEGVQLTSFHVMPVCSPTRACLMTGRYNYRTGVVDTFIGRSLMHPEEFTLAEMLGAAGYRTGIFGKWHLGDNHPLRAIDQGFQEALTLKGGGIGQPSDPPGGDHYQDPTLYRNGKPEKTKGYVTDLLTDGAIDFIARNRERRFFTYIAYNAPHGPLEVPAGYLDRYKDLPDTTARVYAMVNNIDDNIGRLLAKLDELKLAENTLFVFITDNGPQQPRYNAGMRGLKGTVFEGGIRVPCFVRWPAALKGARTVDRVAAHIDLAPTILEACGAKAPEGVRIDGASLLPLLRGDKVEWPDRTLYFQWHRGDAPEMGRACAAVSQRWKWIRQQPGQPAMLFDLQADPGEKTDLASAQAQVAADMQSRYEAWFKDVSSTRGYAPPRIRVGSPHENPVLLTRQDMRGAKAGWGPKDRGHWELEAEREGRYEVRLLFRPAPSGAVAKLVLGEDSREQPLEAGARDCLFKEVALKPGPFRLEPSIAAGAEATGVEYVEIRRLD
jgi:arylsulfatase A-like enzyme